MAVSSDLVKGRKARKRRESMRVFKKWFFGILIALLIVCLFGIGATIVSHNVYTNRDVSLLKESGLYNLVELPDGRKMNVSAYGKQDSEAVYVAISGIGIQNFSVYMQHVVQPIKDDVLTVFIDRAGYGYSDDSTNKQTVQQIVKDYRDALEAADINGPYILVAHEYGGVYASYWASEYPEELEGVIYFDGTDTTMAESLYDMEITTDQKIQSALFKFGFQRIFYDDYYDYCAKSLTQQEAECARALNVHSVMTQAQLSEKSLAKTNYDFVFADYQKNDVPKLYVSSANSFMTRKDVIKLFEFINVIHDERDLPVFYDFEIEEEEINADMDAYIAESNERYPDTLKFAEMLGNCTVTKMPGYERIYEQKTEGIKDILLDFHAVIHNVEDAAIKEVYDDFRAVNWENYQEEHKAQEESKGDSESVDKESDKKDSDKN